MALTLVFTSLEAAAAAKPVRIVLLTGLSNMLGHGEISPLTTAGTLEYIGANDPAGANQFLKNKDGYLAIRLCLTENNQTLDVERIFSGSDVTGVASKVPLGNPGIVQSGDSLRNDCAWRGGWHVESNTSHHVYSLLDMLTLQSIKTTK